MTYSGREQFYAEVEAALRRRKREALENQDPCPGCGGPYKPKMRRHWHTTTACKYLFAPMPSAAPLAGTKGETRTASGVAQEALEHRPTGSEVAGTVPPPVAVAGSPAADDYAQQDREEAALRGPFPVERLACGCSAMAEHTWTCDLNPFGEVGQEHLYEQVIP